MMATSSMGALIGDLLAAHPRSSTRPMGVSPSVGTASIAFTTCMPSTTRPKAVYLWSRGCGTSDDEKTSRRYWARSAGHGKDSRLVKDVVELARGSERTSEFAPRGLASGLEISVWMTKPGTMR
jgi:hypothetical protein